MRSMTGFGEGRVETASGTARVAVACVNHKSVAVQVRSELRDVALEERVRDQVRTALGRGAATVQVAWEPGAAGGLEAGRLAAAWRALAALAVELGAPPPTLGDALSVAGRGREPATDVAAPVAAAVANAMTHLDASRRREGAELRAALRGLGGSMRALLVAIRPLAEARLPRQRQRLTAAIADALGRSVPPEVLAREIAIEAQRIDVSEELVRLASHLDAYDRLLEGDSAVGRELEFIIQELGREANTLSAKANDPELSARCIELKVAVDQAKEQAANVM